MPMQPSNLFKKASFEIIELLDLDVYQNVDVLEKYFDNAMAIIEETPCCDEDDVLLHYCINNAAVKAAFAKYETDIIGSKILRHVQRGVDNPNEISLLVEKTLLMSHKARKQDQITL